MSLRYGESRTAPLHVSSPRTLGSRNLETDSEEEFFDAPTDDEDEAISSSSSSAASLYNNLSISPALQSDKQQSYDRAMVIIGELKQSIQSLTTRIDKLERSTGGSAFGRYSSFGKSGIFLSWGIILTLLLGWPVATVVLYHFSAKRKVL